MKNMIWKLVLFVSIPSVRARYLRGKQKKELGITAYGPFTPAAAYAPNNYTPYAGTPGASAVPGTAAVHNEVLDKAREVDAALDADPNFGVGAIPIPEGVQEGVFKNEGEF